MTRVMGEAGFRHRGEKRLAMLDQPNFLAIRVLFFASDETTVQVRYWTENACESRTQKLDDIAERVRIAV